ncbi:hypothetical protein KFL_000010460 [Klebsormidium nitens]|uniref:Seipin family protein n=1 Tax=Klebsormidium nitens TaxID=105231 RepID=A0A0U9HHN0_KLENI|nr:hypothetical protein KFL_000010460 [Klebsormidium nitens]|eukprot:GAQ77597.1 hypothetical protein KFL_000010460 [Klebsormidium nitens]
MQADTAQTRVPPIPATFTPPLMDPPGPVHTTISKVGRGLAASAMTAVVLLGLFLTAVPIYLTLLRATLPKVTDVKEPLFFDYRLPQPAATMPLLPPELRTKAYAYAAEDKPVKKFPRVFQPGQLYDVTVRLELPDSEQNVQVGIFQVTVQLLSVRDDVVATTTQPAMLHYRSPLVKLARLLAMAIPIVFNFVEERQVLTLTMLKGYQEGPLPVIAVRVLIEPSAGRPPELGLPQIYSAEAEVRTRLTGLAALLYNWRFTSFVWGPFVIFMWELAVAVLCCPGLVLPGFLRKTAPTPARPPVAPLVRPPVSPAGKDMLRTGAAVVGDLEDLESLGIDEIPKDQSGAAEVSADASVSMNGDSTTSESDYTLVGGRRVSIGLGVEIGPSRRRSSGSRGQRPERAGSRERVTVPVLLDGKWDDSMEQALEDILEARVSPEASEASEELSEDDVMAEDDVLGEDDIAGEDDDLSGKVDDLLREDADVMGEGDDVTAEGDDDMPVLEDGAQQGEATWGGGERETGLEEAEGEPGDASQAENEGALLQAGGGSSKLNDLLGDNGNVESVGGDRKQRTEEKGSRPEALTLPPENGGATGSAVELGRSSSSDDKHAQSGLTSESADSAPRRSQSLDNVKASSSNGVNRPDEASGSGAASTGGGGNADDANRGESPGGSGSRSGGESPNTGVYSRFLTRGFPRSGSSGSLSEKTPEKQGVNKHTQGDVNGGAKGSSPNEAGKGEEFQDAVDTLTPTVSDASMQEAVEDNDWLEVPRVGTEGGSDIPQNGTQQGNREAEDGEGNEDEDGQGSSLLGPLLGGLRRRGRTKQDK